jgi:predicted amidohydrolase
VLRVAAVQTTAGPDRAANLGAAEVLVAEAATAGAELIVLPELFSLLAGGAVMRAGAEPLDGPTSAWATEQARAHGCWLVAGSFPERTSTHATDGRYHNTCCLFGPDGARRATYRKIHLFDNEVPGAAFHESASVAPGTEVVTASAETGAGTVIVGFATCYDLRFPELFRALADAGTHVVVLPSAFTAVTGRAHWAVLVRARAIEDQCFVVAAGQVGVTGTGIACHGHSMVVDPWGEVVAELGGEHPGVLVADLPLDRIAEVRARLPTLTHRRLR